MSEIEDLESGAYNELTNSMHQKFEALSQNDYAGQKCTIFRVPENVRRTKTHLFEPAVVSIGPYHRGKQHLRAMEERKWPLLQNILSRRNRNLKDCIAEMKVLEKQARMCYNETIDMDSDSFVEMMLLDASFVIQRLFTPVPVPGETDALNYYKNVGWSWTMIMNDLILIENQIPFFILEKMCYYALGQGFNPKNKEQIAQFLISELASTQVPPPPKEIHHLLHLCHHYVVAAYTLDSDSATKSHETKHDSHLWISKICDKPTKLLKKCLTLPMVLKFFLKKCINLPIDPESEPASFVWSMPCATELQEAGVKVRKKDSPSRGVLDITFKSGVLEIPFLFIEDKSPVRIMNLVALEQCISLELPKLLSTYRFFMDNMVNTTHDVTILQRHGIIDNMLSGEKELALFINQSGQHVSIDKNHYLVGVVRELNKYCAPRKHRYRANLMHNYFSNPWSILSLLAAIFLLLLTTFTQAFYAVLAYHHPPSQSH